MAVSGHSASGLEIRRLTLPDLAACIELTVDRGWLPEEPKWRLMFAVSEIYGIDDPDGSLAGVVGLTRYGPELASVGMMLVATRHSRQGLGRQLMLHVLDQAGPAIVCLYATTMGRPLYEQLGFETMDLATRYSGTFTPAAPGTFSAPSGLRALSAADVDQVAAVDLRAFGGSRHALLAGLADMADTFVACDEPASAYGMAWPNGGFRVIGPVVASSEAVVPGLLDVLLADRPGPVRIDVSSRHEQLAAWAEARGLTAVSQTAIMAYGGLPPGDRSWLYAPANVALG